MSITIVKTGGRLILSRGKCDFCNREEQVLIPLEDSLGIEVLEICEDRLDCEIHGGAHIEIKNRSSSEDWEIRNPLFRYESGEGSSDEK